MSDTTETIDITATEVTDTVNFNLSGQPPTGQSPFQKTVLIGTPTLDGKLDAWYVNSLSDTIKLGMLNNIFIKPIFLAYESILPMSRNELFKIAYDNNFDCLVQIDADVSWEPQALIEIILAKEPVVALPYPLKSEDGGNYNVNLGDPRLLTVNEAGYVKVVTTGAGIIKIDRPVIEALWNSNVFVQFRDKQLKNICEYVATYSSFVGEDITLCNKIRELGFDIWVNTKTNCLHIGNKIYPGNFQAYLNAVVQATNQQTAPASSDTAASSLFE